MVTRVAPSQEQPSSASPTTDTTKSSDGAPSSPTRQDQLQQNTNDGRPDFRSILQHPPPTAASMLHVLEHSIKDPSWDAHKVYFNERESNDHNKKKTKGDEFDEFFDSSTANEKDAASKQVMDRALEKMKQQQQVLVDDSGEVLLDPLGWPLPQAGFETKTAIFTDPLPAAAAAVNPASSFESTDDGDDLDLIHYRPSDYYPGDDEDKKNNNGDDDDNDALGEEEEVGIEILCHGVDNIVVLTPEPVLSKEKRIQMYESRGVDEDSSVEDENAAKDEEADWEEGRQVEYDSMQPAPTEEEEDDDKEHSHVDDAAADNNNMSIDKSDFKNKARYQNVPSFDQSDNTRSSGDAHQPASFQPAADAAKLAAGAASTTQTNSASSPTVKKGFFKGLMGGGKNKNTNSPSKNQSKKDESAASPAAAAATKKAIPLLRPPPEDKVKQWEESQERAKKHLESSSNKDNKE